MSLAKQILKAKTLEEAQSAAERELFKEELKKDPTNRTRYIGAMQIIDKKSVFPVYLSTAWDDEQGNQCFTDTRAAACLSKHIDKLPYIKTEFKKPDVGRIRLNKFREVEKWDKDKIRDMRAECVVTDTVIYEHPRTFKKNKQEGFRCVSVAGRDYQAKYIKAALDMLAADVLTILICDDDGLLKIDSENGWVAVAAVFGKEE